MSEEKGTTKSRTRGNEISIFHLEAYDKKKKKKKRKENRHEICRFIAYDLFSVFLILLSLQ